MSVNIKKFRRLKKKIINGINDDSLIEIIRELTVIKELMKLQVNKC